MHKSKLYVWSFKNYHWLCTCAWIVLRLHFILQRFSTDYIDIASDHLSVYCKFNMPIGRYKADSNERPPLLGWQKATIDNLINYQLLVDFGAKLLCDQFKCMNSVSEIVNFNTVITDLLLIASYETIRNKTHIGLLK